MEEKKDEVFESVGLNEQNEEIAKEQTKDQEYNESNLLNNLLYADKEKNRNVMIISSVAIAAIVIIVVIVNLFGVNKGFGTCNLCGTTVSEETNFCPNCGKEIGNNNSNNNSTGSSDTNKNDNDSSNNSGSSSNSSTKPKLSLSERQRLAEKEILKATLSSMKTSIVNKSYMQKNGFEPENTRYKVGSVQNNGDTFKFYITFYFYDKYDNYKESVKTEATISVDEYGNVDNVNYPWFYQTY